MAKAAVFGVIKDGKPNINTRYYERIHACGVDTVNAYPLPLYRIADECDCLVVCGGGDMNPIRYGELPYDGVYSFDDKFDEYELCTINAFIRERKPILGICRGMQSINVALGGSLIQDIKAAFGTCHSSTDSNICMHEIEVLRESGLYSALGAHATVNSFHHQCVYKPACEISIAAVSSDGVIEAIEGKSLPILGVQWHPERMYDNIVIEYFFNRYMK